LVDEIKELRRCIQELKEKKGDTEPGPFVASENSKHFHRPECKWAADINPRYLIEFRTHEEAVGADYKPCKTCRS
jgi:methylphosphotriester-DNA--protein-cysteine methyltransferase